jgi:hypothetical protein
MIRTGSLKRFPHVIDNRTTRGMDARVRWLGNFEGLMQGLAHRNLVRSARSEETAAD